MPLSEQEQRLLDEMERHLMRNDADVVTAPGRALSYRNIVWGAILVLAGIGALIAGVAINVPTLGVIVGVVGFAIMLGGVVLAVTPSRGSVPTTPLASPSARATHPRAGSSFMDRMNDRWDRRNEGP
jgi:predicted phage tail protein